MRILACWSLSFLAYKYLNSHSMQAQALAYGMCDNMRTQHCAPRCARIPQIMTWYALSSVEFVINEYGFIPIVFTGRECDFISAYARSRCARSGISEGPEIHILFMLTSSGTNKNQKSNGAVPWSPGTLRGSKRPHRRAVKFQLSETWRWRGVGKYLQIQPYKGILRPVFSDPSAGETMKKSNHTKEFLGF